MNTQTDSQLTTTQRPALAQPVTYVRAVIVTGSDDRGNEFAYQWDHDGWVDLYNEVKMPLRYGIDFHPVYVRFGKLHLTPLEWQENGCPMRLPVDEVERVLATQYAAEQEARDTNARADLLAKWDGEIAPLIERQTARMGLSTISMAQDNARKALDWNSPDADYFCDRIGQEVEKEAGRG